MLIKRSKNSGWKGFNLSIGYKAVMSEMNIGFLAVLIDFERLSYSRGDAAIQCESIKTIHF